MRRAKWMLLTGLLGSGMVLWQGCLLAFSDGLVNGWPENRLLNLAVDVVRGSIGG